MKQIIIVIFLLLSSVVSAQIDLTRLVNLPKVLNETSALVFYDGLFWTINDSGGKNKLYAFDYSGKIKRTVTVDGAENHDWEALAISEKYLLIGDFGNNFGRRKNLVIYGVSLENLSKESAKAEIKIAYKYPDQKLRLFSSKSTPFDCESMTVINNSIYLFTKDWKHGSSAVYTLPIKTGTFKATKKQEMNANGLLTDAVHRGNEIWFIGYQNYYPVLWKYTIDNWSKPAFRYHFNDYKRYQVEGITNVNDTLYISAEKSATEQAMFFIPLSKIE